LELARVERENSGRVTKKPSEKKAWKEWKSFLYVVPQKKGGGEHRHQ